MSTLTMKGRGSSLYDQVLPCLRPFQREAVEFAVSGKLYDRQFNGDDCSGASIAPQPSASSQRTTQQHATSDCTEPSLLGRGRILLADEMGLGKTLTSLAIMAYYEGEWPLLIICPASLRYTWPSEIEKFFPSLSPQSVYVAAGFQDIGFTKQKDVKIVIVTYSLMQNRSAVARMLEDTHCFRCVIVDESHNLKQRDSQRTKLLVPILQRADRLLLLSGTPALARPCELWTQLACLAPNYFGKWTAFANRYCDPRRKNIGGRYIMDYNGSSNQLELHAKLKNVMVRRLKSNVLKELPPKQRSIVPVPISSDRKAACAQAMAELAETRESVANLFGWEAQQADFEAKSKLMAAYQASGVGKAKSVAEYLLDWLSGSAQQKILVFAHHKAVLDTIDNSLLEKCPNSHIRIDGSVPTVVRAQLVKKFQSCERIRVGLLSMTAAGVGLTLTAASTVLFAELHWTPGVLAQCEDRAHRLGQTGTSVQIFYAVCKDDKYCVDMALWRMLGRKIGNVDAVVDGTQDVPYLHNAQEQNEFVPGRSVQEELSSFFADSASGELTRRNRAPVKGSIENFFKKKSSDATSQKVKPRGPLMSRATSAGAAPTPSVSKRVHLEVSESSERERNAASLRHRNHNPRHDTSVLDDSGDSDLDEFLRTPATTVQSQRSEAARDHSRSSQVSNGNVKGCDAQPTNECVKWTCQTCTLENTTTYRASNVYSCEACGEYFSSTRVNSGTGGVFDDEHSSGIIEWSCDTCTLDNCCPWNPSGVFTCDACGASFNSAPPGSMESIQTPSTTRCRKSSAAKVSQTPNKVRRKQQQREAEIIVLDDFDVSVAQAPTRKERGSSLPDNVNEIIEIDLSDEETDVSVGGRSKSNFLENSNDFSASFSVSKNSGRISIHLGQRRESSGVNFDLNDVVTSDTADRMLDARADRRSVALNKPVTIDFDQVGIETVLRSLSASCEGVVDPHGAGEMKKLENQLKSFVLAYARLREVEKKVLRDEGQPMEPSEVAQHVARLLVQTSVGSERYSGGAKERAWERTMNGSATEGDAAVLNGKGCAWCGGALHQSSIRAGSTYCSQECAEEGRLRRGGMYSSSRVRSAVFALEGGRCTLCEMDCHALYQQVLSLDPPQRLNKLLAANWRLPKSAKALETLLQNPREGDFWQVDHIRAVAEGGGGCGLENLRTLCVPCHNTETEKLRARLRLAGPDRAVEAKRREPRDFFMAPHKKTRVDADMDRPD